MDPYWLIGSSALVESITINEKGKNSTIEARFGVCTDVCRGLPILKPETIILPLDHILMDSYGRNKVGPIEAMKAYIRHLYPLETTLVTNRFIDS